jgi:hypothetical protein
MHQEVLSETVEELNAITEEALGGLLAIRSPWGEGTEIDVTLPVAVSAERPEASG